METRSLLEKLGGGRRLSLEEWTSLLAAGHPVTDRVLLDLADRARDRLHPDRVVTYVVDRNVNYTNICTSGCNFCAFQRRPGQAGGYLLEYGDIFAKVEETLELGGSGILLQGGLHPDLPLSWYTGLLAELKRRYRIHLHAFSPTEVHDLTMRTGLDHASVLRELRAAGLDSLPGGGAEILVDEIRSRRRRICDSGEWLAVMEAAHGLGIPTTCTMVIGLGETTAHRLLHLEKLRALQDRTGGFISFIPWTYQPDGTPLGKKIPDRVPLEEYLRWLAIARLYLDNIRNVQVSWLTQGIEGGKRGLRAGANDLGSIMIEENVVSAAGARHRATERTLLEAIVEEGFIPVKRNAAYRRLEGPRSAGGGDGPGPAIAAAGGDHGTVA